jgi:predicted GTPase
MDTSKIADLIVFVINTEDGIDEHGKNLISLLRSQGTPSNFFVLQVNQ